ncbi:dTDP-4-dehydrorhamnose reductase [Desulfonatronovibrio hydrogenovorans]|uniref:dTDP-4-dehydrorhamnose reductase n=1 Tax=Desulfonatronovibrio hydrogenovorans TaxID=53245 RepID=UPI000491F7EC|nr:dTDP-4-dehydrorhamnose reductase [Desulfonatronovibrio hydrogenovorans]
MSDMKALILGGKSGLLGQALDQVLQKHEWQTMCPDRNELDVFNSSSLTEYIEKNRVRIVFNAIAYTMVDQAEEEDESAYDLNRKLPAVLGKVCKSSNIGLVHFSSDFVFDGKKNTPYTTEDSPNPQSVYGKSKYEGEKVLLSKPWDKLLVIRTAWLFGPFKTNFVDKIISLARKKDSLNVVHDQVGSPTYTLDLARYTLNLVNKQTSGLYHLANKGRASWCELASEAIKCAGLYCRINPIQSSEYPQKANRPPYSVLDCSKYNMVTGKSPRPWIQSLRDYIYHYQ